MLRARSDQRERAFSIPRPERTCLSEEEEEVAEALIAVAEAVASTVAAVATTTSEGAAAAAISEAAAEEGLDEGAVVEALINFKIKDLQNMSSVSRFQSLIFAVGMESGGGFM